MEIRQLEYFQAVSSTGSFTRAAENLHVAQPSITNAIHKLEQELGIVLFDRSQKKVALTVEGRAFLARTVKILREISEAVAEMNDFRNLNLGTIKMAVPPMIGAYLFPNIFTNFKKEHPNLELLVFEEGSLSARSKVEREELDLGLVILPQSSNTLNTMCITWEQIVLCVSPQHHLAAKREVSIRELRDEAFIMLKEDSYHRTVILDECQKSGFTPRIVFSSSQIQTIKALVSSGVGISFLMEMVCHNDSSIVGVPLIPSIDICIGLVWKKDKYLSKAALTLINFVNAYTNTAYFRNPSHIETNSPT